MLILRYQCRVLCVIYSIIVKEKIKTIMMLIITGQDNLAILLLLLLAYSLVNMQELDLRVSFWLVLSHTYSAMDIKYDSMKSLAHIAISGT